MSSSGATARSNATGGSSWNYFKAHDAEIADKRHVDIDAGQQAANEQVTEPELLLCPITQVMFQDPVVNRYGHTYERAALKQALRLQLRDPLTNLPLQPPDGGPVFSNRNVRRQVSDFLENHPSYVPQGWADRRRNPVASDATLKEEVEELHQLKEWTIRRQFFVRDLIMQVRRFMWSFMFRPKEMLPSVEIGSSVGRFIGVFVGVWVGPELAMLGAHVGWKLIIGILRIVTGVNAPLSSARDNIAALARMFLSLAPVSPYSLRTLRPRTLSDLRPALELIFERPGSGNRAFFMQACEKDIWYFQAQVMTFDVLQNVGPNTLGSDSGQNVAAAAVPPMKSLTKWHVGMQKTILKILIHIACLHAEFAGFEAGFKTACTNYSSSRSVLKAMLASSLACARLGLITGCGYAMSALQANALLALLSSLLPFKGQL